MGGYTGSVGAFITAIVALLTAVGIGVNFGIWIGRLSERMRHLEEDFRWIRDTIATPLIQRSIQSGFNCSASSIEITEAGRNILPPELKEELVSLLRSEEFKKRMKRDNSLENAIPFVYTKIGKERLLKIALGANLEIGIVTVVAASYLWSEWKKSQ